MTMRSGEAFPSRNVFADSWREQPFAQGTSDSGLGAAQEGSRVVYRKCVRKGLKMALSDADQQQTRKLQARVNGLL